MPQPRPDNSATLRDYARVVLLRKWLVLGIVVFFTLAAAGYSLSKPKVYEATARLMYSPPTDIANPSISSSTTDLNTLTLQLQSIGNTLGSPDVGQRAMSLVPAALRHVSYTVSASVVTPSSASTSGGAIADSVSVTVRAATPTAAAGLANAYAAAVIALRKEGQQASLLTAQNVLKQQLSLLKASQSQQSPDYATLLLQLRDLQIAEATANGDFVVIQPATPPSSAASPRPTKTAMMGLVGGLFVGIALAFVIGQFDTRVRDHRAAAEILGLAVIGRVPHMSRQALIERGLVSLSEPMGSVSESLRTLRRNLDWSRIDGTLRSLIVTSCSKGDGKTLTLCNLAVTLARAGSSVVIVDADLRSPQVHRVFNLRNSEGLTSVALGKTTLDDALLEFKATAHSVSILTASPDGPQSDPAPWEGSLKILTSGPLPPNPGEVVASRRVADMLATLVESSADYVLVDTPPLLAFGDAGALASSVDGVVMVANVEKARRPILEDGREVLDALPCRKVGLVVVGERLDETQYAGYSRYSSGRQEH
jgi:Mrp family chromosome partitioning ATPase